MLRKARINAPGALHLLIIRGIERQKIFRDYKDKDNFLDRLGNVLSDTCTPCYAWVLISNHVHLLLKTGNTPISTIVSISVKRGEKLVKENKFRLSNK